MVILVLLIGSTLALTICLCWLDLPLKIANFQYLIHLKTSINAILHVCYNGNSLTHYRFWYSYIVSFLWNEKISVKIQLFRL